MKAAVRELDPAPLRQWKGLASLHLDERTGAFVVRCSKCTMRLSARNVTSLHQAYSDHHRAAHGGVV